jgi:hypothetical protein
VQEPASYAYTEWHVIHSVEIVVQRGGPGLGSLLLLAGPACAHAGQSVHRDFKQHLPVHAVTANGLPGAAIVIQSFYRILNMPAGNKTCCTRAVSFVF